MPFLTIVSHLWDVLDVNPDVDNCRTLGWQLELHIVLWHADALCLQIQHRMCSMLLGKFDLGAFAAKRAGCSGEAGKE